MMQLEFSGDRALILGGSCQLALDLAEVMIASGLRPILGYRSDQGHRRILDCLDPMEGRFETLSLDLSRADALARQAAQLTGPVDFLVDFAQEDLEGLVASADSETVRQFFDAQIAGRALLVQQVVRRMLLQRSGRLLYVSSTAAGRPNPGQGFYAAVKCAAEALYRNVGLELAIRGVTTVILRPGYIDSGRGRRYLNEKSTQVLAKIPMGRPLQAMEVVQTIMFLLSDSARGFNATALTMDGGMSAGK
jgi:3-oxoacyl-[acyl-carrier protein] reductase